jgi:hypothetical protein
LLDSVQDVVEDVDEEKIIFHFIRKKEKQ